MITHVDDGIKQIVDALRRTDQHQRTLIVFMSDVSNIHCGTNPVNTKYLYNIYTESDQRGAGPTFYKCYTNVLFLLGSQEGSKLTFQLSSCCLFFDSV